MRVFVSFGFLPEEAWVEQLAVPLLQHLGLNVIEGKEIPGEIDATIRRRIHSCDALIGFLLRRGKRERDGSWSASDYVRQEIEIALAGEKDVILVVEHGVKAPRGFLQQRQRLDYRAPNRDVLLLALARHLREWIDGEVKVRLSPDTLVQALEGEVYAGKARCRYRVLDGGRTVRESVADIVPEGGGLFTKLLGFRPRTQAQIRVGVNGVEWASTFESHASPFTSIELRPI